MTAKALIYLVSQQERVSETHADLPAAGLPSEISWLHRRRHRPTLSSRRDKNGVTNLKMSSTLAINPANRSSWKRRTTYELVCEFVCWWEGVGRRGGVEAIRALLVLFKFIGIPTFRGNRSVICTLYLPFKDCLQTLQDMLNSIWAKL